MTTRPIDRFLAELRAFAKLNDLKAVHEPANEFEECLNDWYELQQLQEAVKQAMDGINKEERILRDRYAESLRSYFGDNLNEGVNTYTLSNDRKLKLTHKVDRKVEASALQEARKFYEEAAQPGDKAFDDVLRVKYELDKRNYDKLSPAAAYAFSRCLVTKYATPTLSLD